MHKTVTCVLFCDDVRLLVCEFASNVDTQLAQPLVNRGKHQFYSIPKVTISQDGAGVTCVFGGRGRAVQKCKYNVKLREGRNRDAKTELYGREKFRGNGQCLILGKQMRNEILSGAQTRGKIPKMN